MKVNILDYIDKMQIMYGDKEPSSMVQEPRNMYNQGQLVQPNDDGSRPGYKGNPLKGYDRKTRRTDFGVTKVGKDGKYDSETVDRKITKNIYTDKATGKKIIVYKVKIISSPSSIGGKQIAGISGDYKTLLSGPDKTEFSTLKEAQAARDKYYKKNPIKIRTKDPTKDKISRDNRRFHEKKKGGVESHKTAKKGSGFVKGHAGNIFGVNEIRPNEIIYTDEKLNTLMSEKDKVIATQQKNIETLEGQLNELVNENKRLSQSVEMLQEEHSELNEKLITTKGELTDKEDLMKEAFESS